MVVRKRRKSRRLRGRTRTMGWGRVGQHRKSGSRGGFGAVGMHKHKWSWTTRYAPDWYGKRDFKPPLSTRRSIYALNLDELNEIISKLIAENKAVREDDKIVINIAELGFNKLLGRGVVKYPLKIIVEEISSKAREKIESMGGEVVVTKKSSGE